MAKKKSKKKFLSNIKKNAWIISSVILAVLCVMLLVIKPGCTGNAISSDEAANKVLEFAEAQGVEVELENIIENNDFYEVEVSIQGEAASLHITKDGEYFFQAPMKIDDLLGETNQQDNNQQDQQQDSVPKSDKPKAELFVMTHCPYGTQAEKGFIPAIKALGDSIDAEIRFVHYFMHAPEANETPRQICIREEQPDKYLDYLECFLEGDGNADSSGYIASGNDPSVCIERAGIDEEALNTCIEENSEEYYMADSELSKGYGVQGSPTLVINGVKSKADTATQSRDEMRSPQLFLEGICEAFNNPPEECNQELSTEGPSPGFGYNGSSGGAGSC